MTDMHSQSKQPLTGPKIFWTILGVIKDRKSYLQPKILSMFMDQLHFSGVSVKEKYMRKSSNLTSVASHRWPRVTTP